MINKGYKTILLVGAGQMAIDYAKVLKSMPINIIVIGRSENSAKNFENKTGLPIVVGGIDNWLKNNKHYPERAIVAVSNNELGNVARSLLRSGIKFVLLEKPGGLDDADIFSVANEANLHKGKVYIAYNRRFYTSTIRAKQIIEKDDGVKSFTFEFTEWPHIIEKLPKSKKVKENWFFHNSTHIIDLAFYLGGRPLELNCYSKGGLKWHPIASVFSGSGISKTGALFSYHSNWDSPGRWNIEILTTNYRLIFKPLEKLKIQKRASINIEDVSINDEIDVNYKPGLYRQVEAFLSDVTSELKEISQQKLDLPLYNLILKGGHQKFP